MKSFLPIVLLCLGLCIPARAEETWSTDLAAAKTQAANEGRKVLLDFTGSDWCGFCMKLDAEVFSTPEFSAFAKDYVLVRLDYPRKKELPPEEKAQNAGLRTQYRIRGYPTVIIIDASGNELQRVVGYRPRTGPAAYLAKLAPGSNP